MVFNVFDLVQRVLELLPIQESTRTEHIQLPFPTIQYTATPTSARAVIVSGIRHILLYLLLVLRIRQ